MRIAKTGSWLYDGTTQQPVDIVALDYDHWFAIGEADDALEPSETAQPLGPDGCLYYVRFANAGHQVTPPSVGRVGWPHWRRRWRSLRTTHRAPSTGTSEW